MSAQSPGLINESIRKKIDQWLTKYPPDQKRSGLLYALRLVQEQNKGWLSVELMDAVADYFDLPKVAVYEVATFYKMYELKPVGHHKISVCTSISCMLNGAEKILEHLEYRLGMGIGGTSADGQFTLKEAECLASCVRAPVLQIDDKKYHENLTFEKIDTLLEQIKQKEAKNAE